MAKFYAVTGRLSTGEIFSSVLFARTKRDIPQEIKSSSPSRVSVDKFIAIDELPEGSAPLNSSKAVAVAWEKQELLTVSFVFQNIKENLRKDLINDLNAVIAKYGF